MSKAPRRKLSEEAIFTKTPDHLTTQPHENADTQLRDDEIPGGKAVGRATRGSREGDVHRSLYAKPETFDLIRRLAFETNTTAQALYREGLFLMLQKRGHARGNEPEDI
ncbi:hypothetical protein MKK64_02700 [Methylobacterium sp. E-025]|uniref:hypothetical protein n=1 Tax=Methylobacterium sp. E-025 TaxID=2836561 RepID=UPI001FB976BD|nr:hypothetical protein [Methylobacterium sp. E-025]MCJ2110129.1 hypothetical protein [Methylobacterium sp. E-025]